MPYWDEENALKSFRKNKRLLNELSPYMYFVSADGRINKIINTPGLRKAHINAIVNKAVKGKFDGIDLDYEGLLPQSRQSYGRLIRLLADKLHKNDKILSVTLQAKVKEPGHSMATKAQDWTKLGRYADKLRIMAYDYHWKTSPPGPIAPVNWIEQIAALAKKTIPPHKVIVVERYF